MTDSSSALKPPLVPLLVFGLVFAGFLALGVWQLVRLEWKNALQASLTRELAVDVSKHPLAPADFAKLEAPELRRGYMIGVVDFGHVLALQGKLQNGHAVFPVVAPFYAGAEHTLMPAVIGCAQSSDVAAFKKFGAQKAAIIGVVSRPDYSPFLPDNDLGKEVLWRLEPMELVRYWQQGQYGPSLAWVITAENLPHFIPSLGACEMVHDLPNNHLAYAIFWFVMVGVATLMFYLRFLRPYLQSA